MRCTKYRLNRGKPILVREEALVEYKSHQHKVDSALKGVKKEYGMFFNPEWIIALMVNLIDVNLRSRKTEINILEPAKGFVNFLKLFR